MKKLLFSAVFFLVLSLLGCQDSKEEANVLTDISSVRKIGMQISVETANRWIDTYRNSKPSDQGRLLLSPYSITHESLSNALSSVPTLAGVAFHHAIDDSGVHHFIVMPVDATLSLWSESSSQLFLDANTNSLINRETAKSWTSAYEQANPDAIWFHFFGSNIFEEMDGISYFDNLDIVPALNDLNLTQQLLLIVSDNVISDIGGRVKTGTTVYDASSPCPPCPVN
jgi:hypothetical protein